MSPPRVKKAEIQPNAYAPPGPIGNTQGLVVPKTEPNAGGDSAPVVKAAAEEEGWWKSWGSDWSHGILDVVGLVPVFGEVADLANAGIYAAEGDYVNAGISVAAMVPGLGMAATGAKVGTKVVGAAAEGAGKAAGREVAETAAEKAAKEAEEAAAKKGKKDDGGYDKASAGKMKKHEPKCFKKNDKGDPDEYDRQLADQEKGINDLTVKEYLEGRDRYKDIGRKGTGEAQATARADYSKELTDKYKTQLNKQGITGQTAQDKAAAMAADKMSTLAALHNPDMIAGGKDVVTAMGDKGVNSSIGSQWKGRVEDMDKAALEVPESERGNTKMNTKLKRCK